MADLLVIYYSRSGHTKEMAGIVAQGVQQEGLACEVKDVADATIDDLLAVKGIVIGSPTYYGEAAAPIRKVFDDSVKHHGKLEGKAGGAFTSCGCIGGGNETTILSIINSMLVHGMVVQGTASGGHYGPVAVGEPDDRAKKECIALGRRIAKLARKLHG